MTSILWEKLGLHTPPEADLKYSWIWPQSCQLLPQVLHPRAGQTQAQPCSCKAQALTSFVQPTLLHNGYVVHGIRGPHRLG